MHISAETMCLHSACESDEGPTGGLAHAFRVNDPPISPGHKIQGVFTLPYLSLPHFTLPGIAQSMKAL
jgi:hypothetical protein